MVITIAYLHAMSCNFDIVKCVCHFDIEKHLRWKERNALLVGVLLCSDR